MSVVKTVIIWTRSWEPLELTRAMTTSHGEIIEQVATVCVPYYIELMKALLDLDIEVMQKHISLDSVVVEVIIRGTHLGPWRGLPATGKRVEFPLCGIYSFGADNLLAGERIYYDRGMVLGQLGLFHEPVRGWQRLVTR